MSIAPAHVDCADLICAFTVDIRPQPKERPRVVRGHAYTPSATSLYEATITREARKAMRGQPVSTVDGLRVFIVFKQADRRRADLDNLVKSTIDALARHTPTGMPPIGPVMVNDSQVTEIRAQLHRGADVDQVAILIAGPDIRKASA